MTVKAHVNIVRDFEALCGDLQQKLDVQSDASTQMTLKKLAAEEVGQCV